MNQELLKEVTQKTRELQAAGEQYCDCPACAAAAAILAKKDALMQ